MLLTLQSRQLSREIGKVSASALKALLSLLNLSLTPSLDEKENPPIYAQIPLPHLSEVWGLPGRSFP